MEATAESGAMDMRLPWWVLLVQGIAAIVLGLLFLFRPGVTAVVAVQFIAIWWFVSGIFTIVMIFQDRSMWGWKLFSGILGVVVGLMVIGEPILGTVIVGSVFIIIIAIQGLIIGIFDLVAAFRGGGWGIGVIGALSLLFGIVLLLNPMIAASALPWVLGFLGLFFGIMACVAAFGLRKLDTSDA